MASSPLPKRLATIATSFGLVAAFGAAPALAVTTQPGENIFGSGSSFQRVAQQSVFTPKWTSVAADHSQLTNDPTATYTSSSSGHGLAEFGNTTGTLDLTQDSTADNGSTNGYGVPVLDAYAGTDDPPTGPLTTPGTNLFDASAAATGSATTPVDEITVPIAQAPVAVPLSLPTGIVVGPTTQISLTNVELQSIWDANVPASTDYAANTWGAVLEGAGLKKVTGTPHTNQFTDDGSSTGGQQGITLQARSSPSGTTYVFRGFLYVSQDPNYPLSSVTDDNASGWPVTTQQTGNTGGSQLVADTTATPGSIGYAVLADVATATPAYTNYATLTTTGGSHDILFARMQDNYDPSNPGATPIYVSPQGTTKGSANVYTGNNINVNGASPTKVGFWTVPFKSGTTLDPTGSWGGTLPDDPDVYDHSVSNGVFTKAYPIVGATFDLAWNKYSRAGTNIVADYGGSAAQAQAAGASASSFLKYVVSASKGQADLAAAKLYYAKLPAKIDGYATTAAGAIVP